MVRTRPFEDHPLVYEDWFERNRFVYESELLAVRAQLPESGRGVEIGVGSGRFAAPLAIHMGLEPAVAMRAIARDRGIEVIAGVAEALPFKECAFELALMVTTICFLDNTEAALKEAYRVLRPNGSLIIGLIDKNSTLGKIYLKHRNESAFYKVATFYSVDEVVDYLRKTGFRDFGFSQTIFRPLQEITAIEPVVEGYGEGSFVVIRARK
ncbi:MAG: class I SAM-dependent methyltransferase [Deltaproteobacteria bacterium]|nr:class I SAM-dependent methyltransferase [Deltaproteobacteria bacterium]